ncbi:uncharacterized protein A4U43_C03F3000 [Asparagus officinalis]|uniref:LanC-like protein GCL1 n=1 Tax=Asparagus officinalis TaxID=4686 RepID=A0A5P1F7F8_ASPOF|nr:lanC-like protein GCL1 [Asparagus officinalis]ONK74122.1 uncharacterized protein A4U43_C03F3000 [Asparagus officinalis]
MSTAMVRESEHEEEMVERIEPIHVSDVSLESFLKAAVSLKNKVVDATWTMRKDALVDPTAYTGLLGTAMVCLRSYEATGCSGDLNLCAEIADTCTVVARNCNRDLTFLCGRAGVYALGAVVANYRDDQARRDLFLDLFFEAASDPALPVGPEDGGFGMPYELLHGRAGFLYAALFINQYLGPHTIPDQILNPIINAVLAGGRAGSSVNSDCPLMYRWHGTRYMGAAHGLAGVLHVLLQFRLERKEDAEDVKEAIRYLIRSRFGQSGNYPLSEGNRRDWLVQWSHGAGGVGIMLCKAAQVFPSDREFRNAAIEAGEVVWKRGLNHKLSLSDGISGNTYTFLSLYNLTKEQIYLERAKAFCEFLYHNAEKLMASSPINDVESKYSLFQGLGGVACLWFDLISPENARFPGFEL